MTDPAGIYISNTGAASVKTKIYYIAKDGTSTDISDCITDCQLDFHIGELVKVTLTAMCVKAEVLGITES